MPDFEERLAGPHRTTIALSYRWSEKLFVYKHFHSWPFFNMNFAFRTVRSLFPTTALPEVQNIFSLDIWDLPYECPFLSSAGPIPVTLGRWLVFCLFWLRFVYTPGPIPAELGQLANLEELDLSSNNLTGTLLPLLPLTCVHYEGRDLPCVCPLLACNDSMKESVLAFLIPFRTKEIRLAYKGRNLPWYERDLPCVWRKDSRIGGWLVFCMIRLCFVYLRSHPGWIGEIGEVRVSAFIQ